MRTPFVMMMMHFFMQSQCIDGAKILVLYPAATKSHKFAVMPVLEALAEKGHQITIVTSYKASKKVANIEEIILEGLEQEMMEKPIDFFTMDQQGFSQIFHVLSLLKEMVEKSYRALVTNEKFRKFLIKERSVDLVIADSLFNEYSYVISDHLRVPIVVHSSANGFSSNLKSMGAPMDYASVPFCQSQFDDQMTFIERLINFVQTELYDLTYSLSIVSTVDDIVKKDFPDSRSVAELSKEISLLIINSHPTTAYPRSLPPSVVSIGALHTRQAKTLPSSPLATFVDDAKDGFIIFTLGSFVPVSSMPKEMLQSFLKAFARLPQRVVWKWEAELPDNLPSNIMMTKWLPQQDLMGHPNAKVFITHGGLLGLQEAIYHEVPVLVLPFGNDQKANFAKVKREGNGLGLEWKSLDEIKLHDTLVRLIKEPNFKGNATRLSELMRDELMPGKDVAVYWIEHVLRHGGTQHLQLTAKNMPFYQRHLLDVIIFLSAFLLLTLFLIWQSIRCIVLKIFGKQNIKRKMN